MRRRPSAPSDRRPVHAAVVLVLAVTAGLLPTRSPARSPGTSSESASLLVYAGAGFRHPIEEAARVFSGRTGFRVEGTYAGSGCLLAQAELAGRGDILLPGEVHYLRQAQKRGLAGPESAIAWLRPVIAVARGNPHRVAGLEDLSRPDLRVGLGDAKSVAVGLVAERWIDAVLDTAGAAGVRGNVRTRALNVNELASQIALGALDAAIVWDATVALYRDKLEAVAPASGAEHRTLITGAVLQMSRNPDAAARFLAFLAGPEGSAIFRKHGYEPAGADALTRASGAERP